MLAHFWAPWCEPCQHMDQLLAVHAESRPGVRFVRVEAEALPELSERYEVAAVPFFVALKGGAVAASLEGADAEALDAMVVAHFGGAQNGAAKKPMSLNDRLAGLIASHPVMLFMKGSPAEPRCVPGVGAGSGRRGGGDHCTEDLTRSAPPACVCLARECRCGFSRKVVDALNGTGVAYGSFDILSDQDVRQGLKEYSDWPTYPQLYVKEEVSPERCSAVHGGRPSGGGGLTRPGFSAAGGVRHHLGHGGERGAGQDVAGNPVTRFRAIGGPGTRD